MGGENEYKYQQLKLKNCGFEEKIKRNLRVMITK